MAASRTWRWPAGTLRDAGGPARGRQPRRGGGNRLSAKDRETRQAGSLPSPTLALEAAPAPDLAARLFHHPAFTARRSGRSRSAALDLAFLDTSDWALAEAGLALEQAARGQRRLLRSLPPETPAWLPGTPPAALALPPGKDPAEADGAALLPVMGFRGRLRRLPMADGVTASLVTGTLRGGASAAPVARLLLTGPEAAVLATIRALATALPLPPPRLALPEEARALAGGAPARPRRSGPPRLDADLDVEGALALSLGHLAEVMLWHVPGAAAGATPEGVHQMRVALRRLRSLLRVFRPACDGPSLRGFDAGLRALAGVLGPARDWDVWLGGQGAELAAARPGDKRIAALLDAAVAAREAAYAALRPVLAGTLPGSIAWQAVALALERPWRAEHEAEAAVAARATPLARFAATALDRRWRRLAGTGSEIGTLPDDEFHALRIEAKRMRYAAELFVPLWGRKRGRRFLARLSVVQDAFGLANDAVVAQGLMGGLARDRRRLLWASAVAEGWALARARRSRAKAEAAWEALLAEGPFWED
jgi:CHAD domain-containing protein